MEKHLAFEGVVLMTLSIMLVTVFLLSVGMYDNLAMEAEDGALAVFAEDVREFLDGNAAVAAFLGIEEETPDAVETTADGEAVKAEAAAYIERYNRLYADLP